MSRGERQRVVLESLRKKGCTVSIPLLDRDEWQELITRDPTIPRSYGQLKRISRRLLDPSARRAIQPTTWAYLPRRGVLSPFFEECLESLYAQLFTGLSNPFLSNSEREDIEGDLDADTPNFENSYDSDHFTLRWTNSSANPADNITDGSIVEETAVYLETARDIYGTTFGRYPYVPTGETKIEVVFKDIGGYGSAHPPDGPIQFDAANWVNQPGIRRPTSAHELFHKLQYAFGYRTQWTPVSPYKWFSEGSASWAEVFVWQRVSLPYKLLDLFANPDLNLFDAEYRALPFWIFFQARQQEIPTANPMLSFLQKYETSLDLTGNEEEVLKQAVNEEWPSNNVYRELAHFFALFSRERFTGAWKQGPSGAVYGDILGPDDTVLNPSITMTEVPLGLGDSYSVTSSVSPLGSDYYRFAFDSGTQGTTFAVTADGSATGDFSYYVVWEKAGAWTKAVFPPGLTEDYGLSETISLDSADALILIVSGRGNGGMYSLSADVT